MANNEDSSKQISCYLHNFFKREKEKKRARGREKYLILYQETLTLALEKDQRVIINQEKPVFGLSSVSYGHFLFRTKESLVLI